MLQGNYVERMEMTVEPSSDADSVDLAEDEAAAFDPMAFDFGSDDDGHHFPAAGDMAANASDPNSPARIARRCHPGGWRGGVAEVLD